MELALLVMPLAQAPSFIMETFSLYPIFSANMMVSANP
jgi:hypothetical protein